MFLTKKEEERRGERREKGEERKEKRKVVCGSEHTLQGSDFQNVGPLVLLNGSVLG